MVLYDIKIYKNDLRPCKNCVGSITDKSANQNIHVSRYAIHKTGSNHRYQLAATELNTNVVIADQKHGADQFVKNLLILKFPFHQLITAGISTIMSQTPSINSFDSIQLNTVLITKAVSAIRMLIDLTG